MAIKVYVNDNGAPILVPMAEVSLSKLINGNYVLVINDDGTLKFKDEDVITGAGGTFTGIVSFYSDSGDTFIGGINRYADGSHTGVQFFSDRGGGLHLRSASSPNSPKTFSLVADTEHWGGVLDGDTENLRWNGKNIVRVVESWKDGVNWYRKYSDGWIEQGGATAFAGGGTTVTFPTPFSDWNYTLQIGAAHGETSDYVVGVAVTSNTRTTTGFTGHGWHRDGLSSRYAEWYACGY